MNPIVRDQMGNWYLVVQLQPSTTGSNDPPGNVCTDRNLPCWLKWNGVDWVEFQQPLFPATITYCTACEWYIDTESRYATNPAEGRVVATYLDKTNENIFLFSFIQNSDGSLNFNEQNVKVAEIITSGATNNGSFFAATALDDRGCAYVLSVIRESSNSSKTRMYHVDLVNNPLDVDGDPYDLNDHVNADDGGDVIVVPGGNAYTIYSDQRCSAIAPADCTETMGETMGDPDDDYFFLREHVVSTDPCANAWGNAGILNKAAFDKVSPLNNPNQPNAHDWRADGHIAMASVGGWWYAAMKTNVEDGADEPQLVYVQGIRDQDGMYVDEDIYEILDRNDSVVNLRPDGISRPSLWMNPGNIFRFFVAYRDSSDGVRNIVVSRVGAILDPDSDVTADIIEWENGFSAIGNNPKRLYPRLVFSRCEEQDVTCAANLMSYGTWRHAAWSSNRSGGETNFLMAVKDNPGSNPVTKEVITAEVRWDPDWGCADRYDNDGDGTGGNNSSNRLLTKVFEGVRGLSRPLLNFRRWRLRDNDSRRPPRWFARLARARGSGGLGRAG